jgi:hypothetical protein
MITSRTAFLDHSHPPQDSRPGSFIERFPSSALHPNWLFLPLLGGIPSKYPTYPRHGQLRHVSRPNYAQPLSSQYMPTFSPIPIKMEKRRNPLTLKRGSSAPPPRAPLSLPRTTPPRITPASRRTNKKKTKSDYSICTSPYPPRPGTEPEHRYCGNATI